MSTDTIGDGIVVGMHYTLKNADGEEIDSSAGRDPLVYLQGAGNIVPGLESQMTGKAVGDKFNAVVAPADGYGERVEDAMQDVPRDQLPENMHVFEGMQLTTKTPEGELVALWVTKVEPGQITVDFNHPLAGVELHFDIEVVSLREATDEEKQHGHPHGPDGQHGH